MKSTVIFDWIFDKFSWDKVVDYLNLQLLQPTINTVLEWNQTFPFGTILILIALCVGVFWIYKSFED